MDDETYLENLNDLFHRDGWKALMTDLEETHRRLQNITDIDTIEQLHNRKGQLQMVNHFLTLENQIELAGQHEAA